MNFLNNFPIARYQIKNQSMEPFLKDGDMVLTLKYFFSKPRVGDVVIFHHTAPPFTFVKRIIKVSDNKFWVEGDNKTKSYDSRKFGFINKKNILGKVILKI